MSFIRSTLALASFHPRIYPSDNLQPLSHLGPVPSSWEFAVHRSGYGGLSLALCRYTVMASVQCPPDALQPPHPCMAYMEASLAVFPHLDLAQITLVRSPRLGLPQGVDCFHLTALAPLWGTHLFPFCFCNHILSAFNHKFIPHANQEP